MRAGRGAGAACGAIAGADVSPDEHDLAVARISHLPHLLAALIAGRLADAPAEHLALSGPGRARRDPGRRRRPGLWEQILAANARGRCVDLLAEVRDRPRRPARGGRSTGHRDVARGDRWPAASPAPPAIPGKHGGPARPTAVVFVAVPDQPGELARLFADAGEIGVNIEDVRIDHDPGRPVGLVELVVDERRGRPPAGALSNLGAGRPTGRLRARERVTTAPTQPCDRWSSPSTDRPGSGKSSTARGVAAPARACATSTPGRCTAR